MMMIHDAWMWVSIGLWLLGGVLAWMDYEFLPNANNGRYALTARMMWSTLWPLMVVGFFGYVVWVVTMRRWS